MKRFLLAALMGLLIGQIAFGASTDVKSQIGTQDLNVDTDGAAHGTFQRRTSTGGTITLDKIDGNQIPWSLDYTRTIRPHDIIGHSASPGRIQGFTFGAAGYTDNVAGNYGVFNYVYDNQVINITDPRYGAVDGADSTAAITAAVAAAVPGDTIFIPRGEYWTTQEISLAGKSHLTIAGSNMQYSRISLASGVSGTRSVFSLLGAAYITMRDLELYSASPGANTPKAILILGRPDAGSYGSHRFDRISVRGYASQAAIYSIASEENSWTNVWAELDGGGGKYVFYTSSWDDLGLTGFTASTNLSMWFNHFRFFGGSTDNSSAVIYIKGSSSCGDIVFRDGFLSSSYGSLVEINAHSTSGFGPYVFSAIRGENAVAQKYGFYFSAGSGTSISRVTIEDVNFTNPSDYFMYADNNVDIANSRFQNNQSLTTSSLFSATNMFMNEMYGNIEFRSNIQGGLVIFPDLTYSLTYGMDSLIQLFDHGGRQSQKRQEFSGATPSVKYGNYYHTGTVDNTTITNLTNGIMGQEITIVCQAANQYINDGGNFTLNGNFACVTVGSTLRLVYDGTAWRELSRSIN